MEEVARGEKSRIETERATAEKDLAEMNSERERAMAGIPENVLDHYDRIVKKHNGVALAEIRNEKCGACGMIIRPHVFQEMRRAGNEELFHCETCTRIIYYIEPSVSAAPAGASASSAAAPASTSHES